MKQTKESFREEVYKNVKEAKEGVYSVSKIFSAEYHLQGVEMLKEMIRFKLDWDNGFSLYFNNDYSKFKKVLIEEKKFRKISGR